MGARARFILTWMGLAALVIVLFNAMYLHFEIDARTQEFQSRAEILAWTFADQAARALTQGNPQDLEFLTSALVLGNVLYAQVTKETQIIAEVSLLSEPLPPVPAPQSIFEYEQRRSRNQSHWDIRRALPDVQGYVRLGLALDPLESAIRAQIFLAVAISVSLLILAGFVVGYAARRVFAMAPLTPAATAVSSSPQGFSPTPSGPLQEPPAVSELAPTATQPNASPVRVGELVIDDASKRVEIRGQAVELSPKEFELLRLLASEAGRVFSTEQILKHVWSDSHMATAQDVKQYVYFLRQKLEENPKIPKLILTVRGFGYKLQP